jgi:hypothetical protein
VKISKLLIVALLIATTLAAGDITVAIAEVRTDDAAVCDETPKLIHRVAKNFSRKTGYKPLTLKSVKKKAVKRKVIPCLTKPPVKNPAVQEPTVEVAPAPKPAPAAPAAPSGQAPAPSVAPTTPGVVAGPVAPQAPTYPTTGGYTYPPVIYPAYVAYYLPMPHIPATPAPVLGGGSARTWDRNVDHIPVAPITPVPTPPTALLMLPALAFLWGRR